MLTKRVIINSKDRNNDLSRSSSDFVVNLDDSYNLQNVDRVTVESITVSNLVYNVNSLTDQIRFTEGAGPIITRTVPIGQYNITDFMTAVETALNSIGSNTFAVSQNSVTKKIEIVNPNISFFILGDSSINKLLGLPNTQNSVSVFDGITNILICDYTPDLGGTDILYVHSKALAEYNSITSSRGSSSIVSYISFHETPFGGTSTRYINDSEMEMVNYTNPRNISTCDIKIRDASGNIPDLQNSNVVLILKAYLNE